MAAEFLKRGWNVVGTVRAGTSCARCTTWPSRGRLAIEVSDNNDSTQIAELRDNIAPWRS
jgi:hypothetical protein